MERLLPDHYLLDIQKEIEVDAPPAVVFEAMLEQIGPSNQHPDGTKMPMKIEALPGGRWFRDLGNNAGHFWGHVQVIKPPILLEITGPMFMSYPVMSHVQYRLTEQGSGTHLSVLHRAMGDIAPEHRKNVHGGWEHILRKIKDRATK